MRYLVVLLSLCAMLSIACCVQADVSMSYGGTVYYVRAAPEGNDENGGLSWDDAKATIQGAIDEIEADECNPAEIWVSAETQGDGFTYDTYEAFDPTIVLEPGVSLFGGFVGRETCRDQRNWREHVATISGHVYLSAGTLDGFVIQDGECGVYCIGTGSVGVISHNTIKSQAGILCTYCASPWILNNQITNFSLYGILAIAAVPGAIENNTIVGPDKAAGSTGIAFTGDCAGCELYPAEIENNIITNCATGISTSGFTGFAEAYNNLYGNTAPGISGHDNDLDQELVAGTWGYELASDSPCIDKAPWTWPWNEQDRWCNARAVDIPNVGNNGSNYVDLGAFEYPGPPVIDRGLPPDDGGINASITANRTNVRWADPDPNIAYGDDFTLAAGWTVDKIRTWAIPSVPGYSTYYVGDHFSKIELYFCGIIWASGDLVAGSNVTTNPCIKITPVTYAGGHKYLRADGGLDQLWQIDFTNLRWYPYGPDRTFAVRGVPRIDRLWFNAARPKGQQSAGSLEWVDFSVPSSDVVPDGPSGWFADKFTEINVQIYAHQVPQY